MEPQKSIWLDGELVPWEQAQVHVLTHTLHYGGGVFEGIRAYATPTGPAVFRLTEHIDRLFYSAGVLEMEVPFTKDELAQAVIEVLKDNELKSAYIRPIIFFGYGKMGLNPAGAPVQVAIAAWPWGAYLDKEVVDVMVSKYIRIHPKSSITDAKICGHYVNSIVASQEIHKEGYDEALFLDFEGNVAEGPGENIFMVKDGTVITPPLGTILAGITRDTVMTILKDQSIDVVERPITLSELKLADEVFFTGTAAEVAGVGKIDDAIIHNHEIGPITQQVRAVYKDIVEGKNARYSSWLSVVNQD